MDAYPCMVEQMLDLNAGRADTVRAADQLYFDGLRHVRAWRGPERRGWDGRR
jgi:hypothetical protein